MPTIKALFIKKPSINTIIPSSSTNKTSETSEISKKLSSIRNSVDSISSVEKNGNRNTQTLMKTIRSAFKKQRPTLSVIQRSDAKAIINELNKHLANRSATSSVIERVNQLTLDYSPFKNYSKQDTLVLKEILTGILKKEEAQPSMINEIKKHLEFKNLNEKDVWRLFLDYDLQEKRGEYGFENEPGYMGSMFKAFEYMLKNLNEELNADNLLKLHDIAVDGVLSDANQQSWGSLYLNKTLDHDEWVKDNLYLRQGYRAEFDKFLGSSNGFGLVIGTNATVEGVKELEEIAVTEKIFYLEKNDYGDTQIGSLRTLPHDTKAYAQKLINIYADEIKNSKNDNDRLLAIAKLCRNLEASHLFWDGNARTIGMLLVNKLLLQNNLSPVIFKNPNCLDAHSISEIVEKIKEGQQIFKSLLIAER